MTKPRILVDCDGVMAHFINGFLAAANKVAKTNYTEKDIVQWEMLELPGLKEKEKEIFDLIKEPGWARNLAVYPGAQEGIRMLSELGDVYVVTSPIIGHTFLYDRIQWLWDHFQIPYKRIIFAYAKHLVEGDFLIDDKPSNVTDWIDAGTINRRGILWAHPYNEKDDISKYRDTKSVIRTRSWSDVAEIIRNSIRV